MICSCPDFAFVIRIIAQATSTHIFFVLRYCDQLTALEGKIPPQDVQIAFKWKDAFDKGSLFTGKMSLSKKCEMLCFSSN